MSSSKEYNFKTRSEKTEQSTSEHCALILTSMAKAKYSAMRGLALTTRAMLLRSDSDSPKCAERREEAKTFLIVAVKVSTKAIVASTTGTLLIVFGSDATARPALSLTTPPLLFSRSAAVTALRPIAAASSGGECPRAMSVPKHTIPSRMRAMTRGARR